MIFFGKFQIFFFFKMIKDKKIDPVSINDMQIPPQPLSPPHKSKKMRNVLKPMEKQFSVFIFLRNC